MIDMMLLLLDLLGESGDWNPAVNGETRPTVVVNP